MTAEPVELVEVTPEEIEAERKRMLRDSCLEWARDEEASAREEAAKGNHARAAIYREEAAKDRESARRLTEELGEA